MSAPLSRAQAVESLASCLYLKMERLDPTGSGSWENLPSHQKEFYRRSIEEILLEKELLNLAIGLSSDSPTTT